MVTEKPCNLWEQRVDLLQEKGGGTSWASSEPVLEFFSRFTHCQK